jgi:predicted anti-sigma-YlaC factor YlaD
MNLTCDAVLDLISIYKDGAASESTAAAIEEHLKQCRDCRRYYKQYDSINRIISQKQAEPAGGVDDDFARLSSALKLRRTIAVVFLAVCAAITVTSAIFALLMRNKRA